MDRTARDEGLGDFSPSLPATLGVELELMLLDAGSGRLASESPALLGWFESHRLAAHVKAEITRSMIEVTSGVHASADTLEEELRDVCSSASEAAGGLGMLLCGGGAHPFREWPEREIFPDPRFDRLYETYGYLVKLFTVFGQHIHVGVPSADDAIYLTHVFNQYVPHLIALSASSPFQRGVDTGYHSSRVHVVSMFPLSGHLPAVRSWRDFAAYFGRMQTTGLVRSMKDFYWDVRPKPEFGTVEVRICDTPLTVTLAADLAALCQAIARRHLAERPAIDETSLYDLYAANRFQAARSACDAKIAAVGRGDPAVIADGIEELVDGCRPHCQDRDSADRLDRLRLRARTRQGDAGWIRAAFRRDPDWSRVMAAQSRRLLERAV